MPHLTEKKLKKNQLFAQEGKRAKDIAFVLEGNLRQFYSKDGEEKTTYFYFENHLMSSYMSCITGQPSQLSIEALTASRLLVFTYPVLQSLYSQSQPWEKFGRLLAQEAFNITMTRIEGFLFKTPEERYLDLLRDHPDIMDSVPLYHISSYLGIQGPSLSRIRKRISGR